MKNQNTRSTLQAAPAQADGARTLRELGLDGGIASELELAFRLVGAVRGEQVVGYTFTTPDGRRYALRVEQDGARPGVARAA